MWSSDRRRLLGLGLGGLAAVLLAGCGYAPVLAPGGSAGALMDNVAVQTPRDTAGFEFRNQIERRLGHAGATPGFDLSHAIAVRQQAVGVTPGQSIVRYDLIGRTSYSLRDAADGRVVASGEVENSVSYTSGSVDATAAVPNTGVTIATLTARRDAERRLMIILADEVADRLLLHFATRDGG